MYVYHYYAIRIINNSTEHIDGILSRETMIDNNWEEYKKIKDLIGNGDSDNLTICSLSLVGYENNS